jgi:superfamily II DNA helicase RecQ
MRLDINTEDICNVVYIRMSEDLTDYTQESRQDRRDRLSSEAIVVLSIKQKSATKV